MKWNVVFAHRQSVEMLEALCEFVSVSMLGDNTDGLFVVDAVVAGQPELVLHLVFHAFLEGQTVTINSFARFGGEYEIEVDETLELFREVNAFGEAEEWEHVEGDFAVILGIFF